MALRAHWVSPELQQRQASRQMVSAHQQSPL
jgi:hypothetical protein